MLQESGPSGVQKLVWEFGIKISSSYINKKWTATMSRSHFLKANGSLDIKEGKMSVTYGYRKQRKIK